MARNGAWGKTLFEVTDEQGRRVAVFDERKGEFRDTPSANSKGKTYSGSKKSAVGNTAKSNDAQRTEIRNFRRNNSRKRR
jgi:hypothetical protein